MRCFRPASWLLVSGVGEGGTLCLTMWNSTMTRSSSALLPGLAVSVARDKCGANLPVTNSDPRDHLQHDFKSHLLMFDVLKPQAHSFFYNVIMVLFVATIFHMSSGGGSGVRNDEKCLLMSSHSIDLVKLVIWSL